MAQLFPKNLTPPRSSVNPETEFPECQFLLCSTMTGVTTTTIGQLRKQQVSLADNPTWVAYNERLFEGLRKAGMPEE
jgi:hypothetical protein